MENKHLYSSSPTISSNSQNKLSRQTSATSVPYQKLPQVNETYLAYVVAIRDPLNFHLDIYWPAEMDERYNSALHYEYSFISEELSQEIHQRIAYSCHLKGVEIVQGTSEDYNNFKEAYILISKRIYRSGNWVLVSVSDIDVYRRILVNIFDVVTRKSLNRELLERNSSKTGEPIAKEYSRPDRTKNMFVPDQQDYHIIYDSNQSNKNCS